MKLFRIQKARSEFDRGILPRLGRIRFFSRFCIACPPSTIYLVVMPYLFLRKSSNAVLHVFHIGIHIKNATTTELHQHFAHIIYYMYEINLPVDIGKNVSVRCEVFFFQLVNFSAVLSTFAKVILSTFAKVVLSTFVEVVLSTFAEVVDSGWYV